MSKKKINSMIPQALNEVKTFANGSDVESKYMSAIASIGVSVLQSGIYATKLFYDAKSDKRKKIPQIISSIIGNGKSFEEQSKEDILNASTALKLAIRTYRKVDNKEDSNE